MARGLSVHIGLNACDPSHYANNWSGPLEGCEADADVYIELAKSLGYKPTVLKTSKATRVAVVDAIKAAATTLGSGDIFLLTYAGHGAQMPDADGDEDDMVDETWCLFDGELLDDELNVLWSKFKRGVRILVISDSCHSGSVTRDVSSGGDDLAQQDALFAQELSARGEKARLMPRDVATATLIKNQDFYNALQLALPNPRPQILASVRLLSGCQDNQISIEKDGQGVFTYTLKKIWDKGRFSGNYHEFHQAIIAKMKKKQQPNHLLLGTASSDYNQQTPFTID